MGRDAEEYARSNSDPAGFWGDAAGLVHWDKKPTVILDDTNAQLYRWFSDGTLNTCFNALDRHVILGRGEQIALIHESPLAGTSTEFTYAELLEKVAHFAGVLHNLGVVAGDRVVIYMPMVPEAVIAMLACARLGAVHCVVSSGLASAELAARIDDATPRVIVTASCGLEPSRIVEFKPVLDEALNLAEHTPDYQVLLQRKQHQVELDGNYLDWHQVLKASAPVSCTSVKATDSLYILYTPSTTEKPHCIVRDNGGHAVALTWSMKNVYNAHAGDVWWSAWDVSWEVGHSYIVYAPLLTGATSLLYEGTPDAGSFWRTIEKHQVKGLFTASTAIRAIKKEDPDGDWIEKFDLSSFKNLFLAGERLDPDTNRWASDKLGVQVIENWWQPQTGWPTGANLCGLEPMPMKPGSPSLPVPGHFVGRTDDVISN